jgi:membrane-associated protein
LISTALFDTLNAAAASGGLFDLPQLLKTVGYLGLFAIIFAESGLLIGFFLPGDSLLFTAGVLSSAAASKVLKLPGTEGLFNIWLLAGLCFIAAVLGDSVGYWFGAKAGPRIFTKEESLFFKREYVLRAQAFYEKHGGKTIILARFLPVVRTFAPIVAGVANMKYSTFLAFNLVGGFAWAVGLTFAGYFLGEIIPPDEVDKYIIPIVVLIIIVSIAPTAYHILKEKENRAALRQGLKNLTGRRSGTTAAEKAEIVEQAKK